MKVKEILASALVIFALSGSAAFAMPTRIPSDDNVKQYDRSKYKHDHHAEYSKDPIKALEAKKEKVQRLLNAGKLTQEQADEILRRIDSRIAEVKEFQKLPLEQKKEKVLKDLRTQMDQLIKEGKMTKEEADKMMEEAKEKIKSWNGKGFPCPKQIE